jgi:hypothetical protein
MVTMLYANSYFLPLYISFTFINFQQDSKKTWEGGYTPHPIRGILC